MKRIAVCLILMAAMFTPTVQGREIELSNKFVTSVAVDGDNNVWVGTDEGLNRFDGVGTRIYYKHSSRLAGNGINYIFADRRNPYVWVALRYAGLSRIDTDTDEMTTFLAGEGAGSLSNNDITCIDQDEDGNIWASTFAQGINRFDSGTGTFTAYRPGELPGFLNHNVQTFRIRHGKLYIGYWDHGLGIVPLNPDEKALHFSHIPGDKQSLPADDVRALFFDKNDNLWVGTGAGLSLYSEKDGTFINFLHDDSDSSSIPRGTVCSITQKGDAIIVALDQAGVAALDTKDAFFKPEAGTFSPISPGADLHETRVSSIAIDNFGNFWFGTYGHGLVFSSASGSGAGTLDADGEAASGLTGENGGARCTLRDKHGRLWTGGHGTGLQITGTDGREKRVAVPADVTDINSILEDGDKIWAGTNRGLLLLSGKDAGFVRLYTMKDGLDDVIMSLALDGTGRLLLGTFGRGLIICDSNLSPLADISTSDGLLSNGINHIIQAEDGTVWIATREGLGRIDIKNEKLIHLYTREDGLANDYIRALAEDHEGNIWASTNIGISCILRNGETHNYNYRYGIPDGGYLNASSACTPDGRILFGSTNGIASIIPSELLSHKDLPPVRFTNGGKSITAGYKDNHVTLSFCIPDYSFSENTDYEYRIADLDPEWRSCGNTLSFDHLPYGRHTVEVRAGLQNQGWDGSTSSIRVDVIPPVWLTWWAKALYILILSAIAALCIRRVIDQSRKKNQARFQREALLKDKEINEERLKFYTNITHELRTPLTLILGPLDDLNSDKTLSPSTRKQISNVRNSANQLLSLINQLLDFRKTETENKKLSVTYGNLSDFVTDIGSRFSGMSDKVSLILNIEPDVNLWFDPDFITSILNNLLSNSQKFTTRGFIELDLARKPGDKVSISVTDSGCGIGEEDLKHIFERFYQAKGSDSASGTGIGLALVSNLCKLHRIDIKAESQPGEGSTFTLTLDALEQYPEAARRELEDTARTEEELMEEDVENGGRISILVVEDNAGISGYIRDSLSGSYLVKTAENGREGLRIALRDIPDIIISDIMMPVMDGIDFCKAVKNDVRTSHIPVIMLTAKTNDESRKLGYDVGADSYLVKPFNKELISSRIENILKTRRNLATSISKGERIEELSSIDNDFMKKFTELVEANMSNEDTGLPFLAQNLCMSQSTLYRKIKTITGLSPVENIRNIRLNKAAGMLVHTDLNISEICWKIGIGSPIYFRDCFKERYGKTPSAFREESRPAKQKSTK